MDQLDGFETIYRIVNGATADVLAQPGALTLTPAQQERAIGARTIAALTGAAPVPMLSDAELLQSLGDDGVLTDSAGLGDADAGMGDDGLGELAIVRSNAAMLRAGRVTRRISKATGRKQAPGRTPRRLPKLRRKGPMMRLPVRVGKGKKAPVVRLPARGPQMQMQPANAYTPVPAEDRTPPPMTPSAEQIPPPSPQQGGGIVPVLQQGLKVAQQVLQARQQAAASPDYQPAPDYQPQPSYQPDYGPAPDALPAEAAPDDSAPADDGGGFDWRKNAPWLIGGALALVVLPKILKGRRTRTVRRRSVSHVGSH